MQALQRGNKAMLDHNEIVAMAEFRRALEYDPTNDYALQRLRDAIPQAAAAHPYRQRGGAVGAHRVAAQPDASGLPLSRRLARAADPSGACLRHHSAVRRLGQAAAGALRHSGRELRHRHAGGWRRHQDFLGTARRQRRSWSWRIRSRTVATSSAWDCAPSTCLS